MKFSAINFTPRGMRPDVAAAYVGSEEIIQDMVALKLLKPRIRRHKLTVYDRRDIDAALDKYFDAIARE
jgi:hypothetical protein